MKKIRKQVSQCLVSNGFCRKRNSLFVRERKDIVEYFVVEHPPGSFYFTYCIYPLFMPAMDYIILSFGERLEHSLTDRDMIIYDIVSQDYIDRWCLKTDQFIQNRINRFVQGLDTVDKMIRFLNATKLHFFQGVISISTMDLCWIAMYANLCAHDYPAAADAAEKYLAQIDIPRFTDEVRKRGREEYQTVIDLSAAKDDDLIDQKVSEWRNGNRVLFRIAGKQQ